MCKWGLYGVLGEFCKLVIMVAMMHALAIVKLPLRPYLVPLNHSEINPMYPSSMHVPAGCFPDARLYSQSIITCCLSLPLTVLKDNPTFDSAGWSAVELNLYGCSLILLPRRGDYVHQQLPQMWVRERTALPGRTLKYLTSASTLH